MKKGKLIGKIFGIALVFVMVGAMLGGTPGSAGVALADGASGVFLDVPYFSQCDGRWASRACCDMDPNKDYDDRPDVYRPGTLYWFGCAITSFAMVLNYYGVNAADSALTYSSYFPSDTNPGDLSKWLGDHGGCTEGNLHWRIDMDGGYSNSASRGIRQIEYLPFKNGIDATQVYTIKVAIECGNPVIVSVRAKVGNDVLPHFVVITGIAGDTYYINDPGWPEKTTLASYDNKIYSVRIWDGTPPGPVMPSGLYAGSSAPGLVYYYVGGNDWTPISSKEELGNAYAVLCLAEYRGHLYAGVMTADNRGRVYRYDGDTNWTLVGDNMDGAVCSLAVYQGDLYAGTSWSGMKLYRYEGNPNWRPVIDSPIWSGTRSLYIYAGYLLMGDIGWDYMGHWNGSTFTKDQMTTTGSCIYDYQDYGDSVYAAAYGGRMWLSSDGINWSLDPGFENYYDGNMWELEAFKSSLYMSYNNGELWASDGSGRGTCVYTAPDGIISMTTGGYSSTGDPPYLYFGTGGEAGYYHETEGIANIYRYNGNNEPILISDEDEFGAGIQVLYAIRPRPISWYLCSPADMIVTDPDGLTIGKELNEIPGASYTEIDINGDGDLDDVVNIPDRKIGDYLITVIPEPGASPTDTYTLWVLADGVIIILAENVQISDIPSEGYIVRSTETEIMQIIPATIDFDPDASNLRSKGKYVTAYIELPPGYDVSQINISSIRLNDTVPALGKPTEIGDYDNDGLPDLMVKFHRTAVQDALTVGEEVGVTITGEVNEIIFEGSDTIRVITAAAPHGRGEWTRVSTPTTEGWVLVPDSVIVDYAVADDGDVAYAIVYSYGDSEFHLLKSADGAATWEDIMDALEEEADGDINWLVAVATDAEDADFVAVALEMTDLSVRTFISDDGGATFKDAGEIEDGGVYFPDGYHVSDLEVSPEANGMRNIAIGGRDNYGDAALFRSTATGDSASSWRDATDYLGDYPGWDDGYSTIPPSFTSVAVVDIHFSPSWAADKTILVTTVADYGPYDVFMQSGTWGTSEGWNEWSILGIEAVPIIEDVDIPMWLTDLDAGAIAGITLPEDYNGRYSSKRYAWVWVNYFDGFDSVGEIFRVKDDDAMRVNWQIEDLPWLTNISYQGTIAEGKAIAGVLGTGTYDPVHGSPEDLITERCDGVQVYRNDAIVNMDICCKPWQDPCKLPTGAFALEAFYVGEDKAYAVSLWGFFSPYDEDAWSVSFDDGDCWNQLSLVDTHIDYLSDVAVSPDCNKTMLVSVNEESGCGCDSVWLKAEHLPEAPEYSGRWMRTWCGELEGDIGGGWERGLLRLNPEETTGETVYLVDAGTHTVYWSELEGLNCWDRGAASVDHIVDLAEKDADTLYALDYYGDVAMSDDYAIGWHEAVDSDVEYGWTIAVQGDDIIVGGCDGDVSYSDDGGETFTELEDIPVTAEYTLVTVAFDSYFDDNNTIYAAVAGFEGSSPTTGGIYRWVIGESDEWENLGAEDYAYTGVVLNVPSRGKPKTSADTGGVLYASYVSGDTTGVARCLTPAEDVCCSGTDWDYLTRGLTSELFKMTPDALKICGCLTADIGSRLFAIDSSEYYDIEKSETGTVWSLED